METLKEKLLSLLVIAGISAFIFGQVLSQICLHIALVEVKENLTIEMSRMKENELFNSSEVSELMALIKNFMKMDTALNSTDVERNNHTNKTDNTIEQLPHNCVEVYQMGEVNSNVYRIYTPDGRNVSVFCDMDTAGGGWTVFQRRKDGSVLFNRTWNEYKNGFGSLPGEFWLGNDAISSLTSNGSFVLRVDLWSFRNTTRYAEYEDFVVNNESDNYRLNLGKYSGTAGEGYGLSYSNNMQFTTIDRDNDLFAENCAIKYGGGGGFWYKFCEFAALNCAYFQTETTTPAGINWVEWLGRHTLKGTEMKFRPKH